MPRTFALSSRRHSEHSRPTGGSILMNRQRQSCCELIAYLSFSGEPMQMFPRSNTALFQTWKTALITVLECETRSIKRSPLTADNCQSWRLGESGRTFQNVKSVIIEGNGGWVGLCPNCRVRTWFCAMINTGSGKSMNFWSWAKCKAFLSRES